MPANFLHGVETIEVSAGPLPISLVKTAVIGLVGSAPIFQADSADRTLNMPVLILNDNAAAQYFGSALPGYTIPQAIDAILEQQVNGQGAGAIVVVNVFDPAVHKSSLANQDATFGGDDTADLGHPGAAAVVVKSADLATTYVADTHYSLDAAAGKLTRIAVAGGGGIAAGATVKASFDYADPSKVTAADIIGTTDVSGNRTGMMALRNAFSLFGFHPKILIAPGFSPLASVATELNVTAQALRAVAMVDAPIGTTFQQALAGRGPNGAIAFNTSSERTILCYPYLKVFDTALNADRLEPYSQRLAGVMAARDLDKGYWWSPSNCEIQGIDGVERNLTAMINDPESEVNLLNEAGIVTIFNSYGTGFRTWGNRSAAWPTVTDPKNFISIRRVADVIAESIEYSMLQHIDQPITNAWIDSVTESVNAFLRTLVGRGALVGGNCWFDRGRNDPAELALGHIVFNYSFMPPPPAERITFESLVDINMLKKLGNPAAA
ncbi:MAG: phage tail sheath subtilisin-like domain-containing protein [Desulfovibrionaceae bacterium]|nr:phage tail sheath subtilisin-like domain-containing protein [Desulfovibrionaceae bacterium]MBF0513628.1 phage tail sheath subtilisin-like domain-containing protein [Desulfovibrionaceae bacterium]